MADDIARISLRDSKYLELNFDEKLVYLGHTTRTRKKVDPKDEKLVSPGRKPKTRKKKGSQYVYNKKDCVESEISFANIAKVHIKPLLSTKSSSAGSTDIYFSMRQGIVLKIGSYSAKESENAEDILCRLVSTCKLRRLALHKKKSDSFPLGHEIQMSVSNYCETMQKLKTPMPTREEIFSEYCSKYGDIFHKYSECKGAHSMLSTAILYGGSKEEIEKYECELESAEYLELTPTSIRRVYSEKDALEKGKQSEEWLISNITYAEIWGQEILGDRYSTFIIHLKLYGEIGDGSYFSIGRDCTGGLGAIDFDETQCCTLRKDLINGICNWIADNASISSEYVKNHLRDPKITVSYNRYNSSDSISALTRQTYSSSYSNGEKDASVFGRAVAGAIIAGPAGAIVGALSAVDKNNKKHR